MPLLKLILASLLILFSLSAAFAQREEPEFGIFSNEEQNLKVCNFDKEADAIILLDVGRAIYNDQYNLIVTRRIRLKILKEKGVARANIQIPFYNKDNFEFISDINAVVHTTNEAGEPVISQLKKSEIFTQKINEKISVVKFALPNVKVGSIIDYTYTSNNKNYGGLQDWYFQKDVPTLLSRFYLTVVPNTEFAYVAHKSDDLLIDIESDKTNGNIRFEMKEVAGLRDEPFMDAAKDYIQRVEFQLSSFMQNGNKTNYISTWDDVSKELMQETYFGKAIDKKIPNSEALIAQISAQPYSEAKLNFAYEYVRKNFSWNGINSKYAEDGLKEVWEKRKGNSGEINLLLLNLLKAAGLQAYPLLVSERDHGVVRTQFPFLDQFNKVVAFVNLDGEKLVLDATDEYTPIHLIPFNILNTNALIVNTKKGGIVELKDDVRSHSNRIEVQAALSEDGIITGKTIVNSSDYARVERVKEVKASKEKYENDYIFAGNRDIKIDSLEVINTEADSLDLNQNFKFSTPITSSGNYKLLNLNWFSGLDKNPFISDNRFTNINFGSRRNTNIHETFLIPTSYETEALPKNVQMTTPDRSLVFTRIVSKKDNLIDVQLRFQINKTVFPADEYFDVKEYYKKLNEYLNEQIVLNKK